MGLNKIKKGATSLLAACMITSVFSIAAMAASESLNGGGATWSGGENADNILYSTLQDNKSDGGVYDITVWVTDDKGGTSEKSGTTSGVGEVGQVTVTRGATHSNPFVAEKTGYKNFVAKAAP